MGVSVRPLGVFDDAEDMKTDDEENGNGSVDLSSAVAVGRRISERVPVLCRVVSLCVCLARLTVRVKTVVHTYNDYVFNFHVWHHYNFFKSLWFIIKVRRLNKRISWMIE